MSQETGIRSLNLKVCRRSIRIFLLCVVVNFFVIFFRQFSSNYLERIVRPTRPF